MYSEHSGDDYRDLLQLPRHYHVEGVLAYGCWDLDAEANQLPLLRKALDGLGIDYELQQMTHASLGHAYELTVAGVHYWFVPVMGTAVLAQYLHIAALLGSKRNLLLGIVGGLGSGMRTADFVLPTWIRGNDNARYYARENRDDRYQPDALFDAVLRSNLPDDVQVWHGPTLTCEMMLAESQADVDGWAEAGYLGVEMEGALTFALSHHFDIPAAALFYVADNLAENETMVSESYARHHETHLAARELQYMTGLRTILNLPEKV